MGRAIFERYWKQRYAEKMTPQQALGLLQKHLPGVTTDSFSREQIGKYRRDLAKKYHPDTGYVGDDLALLNTALDILEKSPEDSVYEESPGYTSYRKQDSSKVPVWAWAGYSGGYPPQASIYTEDYSDINFIKKKSWEISGAKSTPTKTDEYNFMNFDGRYGRGSFTVYANEDTLQTVAGWLVKWDSFNRSKAVVVGHQDFDRYMVFPVVNGQVLRSIGFIESDSFNRNPFNDQQFHRHLNQMLEKNLQPADQEL